MIATHHRDETTNPVGLGLFVLRYRRFVIIVAQMSLVAAANYGAFQLRFDGNIPDWAIETYWSTLPWLLIIRGMTFIPFGLYAGLWRYASIWDLRNIVVAIAISSLLFLAFVQSPLGPDVYPRTIYFLDALLIVCLLGGIRLVNRVYREIGRSGLRKTVLVYGAGDAGEMVVRDMRKRATDGYEPIGFIDDDRAKVGQRIHGVRVLGTRADLARIINEHCPQEILIAMPAAHAAVMRGIVRALEPFKIKITTIPALREILEGRVAISQIRNLAPEDLLDRARIGLSPIPLRRFIQGRRVMVTGAGGSIGSELCRQVAGLGPTRLILFERHENSLFAIANDLMDRGFGSIVAPVVADVTDAIRVEEVLVEHQPEIIFHAAAHKHVPLMEHNPCEAIKNNVTGTRILAETAERYGVDRFVLISTDKAVNPTNVMGASKRVAELLIQTRAPGSGTSFFAVRFGNVLASNGSVVPRFVEQIKAGGPVTVTHPEMRRYFMLIPEGVELVLHAAAAGESGQIYLLEMGEQVRVVDLARNLIRLSGFVPDAEIQITFVGLRPGEKLQEELVGRDEVTEPSGVAKILQVRPCTVPELVAFSREVAKLERLASQGKPNEVLAQLKSIVPEFTHQAVTSIDTDIVERVSLSAHVEQQHAPSFGQICRACGSQDVHRSRAHTLIERLHRVMSETSLGPMHGKKLFRCHMCGWRGWLVPMEKPLVDGKIVPSEALNLAPLDTTLGAAQPAPRRAFIPRELPDVR